MGKPDPVKWFAPLAALLLLVPCIPNALGGEGDVQTSSFSPDRGALEIEGLVVTESAEGEERQVIKDRELRTHTVVDLAEILSDELVEVQMIRKSGYGNEVSLRGFGQSNIHVLLDGGILEGACGSRKDPSLSHINMLTVQKIVVQEGPFDVTKPGCLGGYIDVITRKPAPGLEGEVIGKTGSYRYASGGVTTGGGTKTAQALFGYTYSESGQYEDGSGHRLWTVREGLSAPYNKKGRDSDAFQKHDVWGKIQFTPNDRHRILFEHTFGEADDILTPRVAFDTDLERTNLTRASWEISELGDLSKGLTISFYRNEVDHYPFQDLRAVALPRNNTVESVITGGAVQNVTETDLATLTYGIDIYHRNWWGKVFDSLTGARINPNLVPDVQTLDMGGYLQMDRTWERWSLGMGVRYDRFRQEADRDLVFTRRVTDANRRVDHLLGGHVSAQYFLGPDAMLFGGVGRSHRTPESTERYIQGSPTFFGNPCLDPTANTEADLGFRYERGPWTFQTKGFYSRLDDYIYQVITKAGHQTYANIDARIWGGDVTASLDLAQGLSVEGGLAYQRGRKESQPENNPDRDLGQIAPMKGRLALVYDREHSLGAGRIGLSGTVEWIHSEAARDIDEAVGEKRLPEWDVLNLRGGFHFGPYSLNLGVDNVFDREYAVANSYEWDVIGGTGAAPAIVNEPGRFIYADLEWAW